MFGQELPLVDIGVRWSLRVSSSWAYPELSTHRGRTVNRRGDTELMFNMFAPFALAEGAAQAAIPHPLYARMEEYWEKKVFRCQECRYTTDRKNNLKRHIATMHQECDQVLECCDIKFACKASLRNHAAIFHRNGYRCRLCNRNFCRKALLKRHLSVHSGQKDFVCELCDYATSHKSNLERHKKVHRKFTNQDEDELRGSPQSSRGSGDVDINVEDVDDDIDIESSEGNTSSERATSEGSSTPKDRADTQMAVTLHSPEFRSGLHPPRSVHSSPELRLSVQNSQHSSPVSRQDAQGSMFSSPEVSEIAATETRKLYEAFTHSHPVFSMNRPYYEPPSLLPSPYVSGLLRPTSSAVDGNLLKPFFHSELILKSPYVHDSTESTDLSSVSTTSALPLKKRFRRRFGVVRQRPDAPKTPQSVETPSVGEASYSSPGSGHSVHSGSSPGEMDLDLQTTIKMSSPSRIFSRPYKCSRCGMSLSSQADLTRHLELWHAPTVWPLQPIVTIIEKRKKLGLSTDLSDHVICLPSESFGDNNDNNVRVLGIDRKTRVNGDKEIVDSVGMTTRVTR